MILSVECDTTSKGQQLFYFTDVLSFIVLNKYILWVRKLFVLSKMWILTIVGIDNVWIL